MLEVKDLRTHIYTRWGTVKAVDGVSFSVREGESVGLVGESGCGKTMTCLSILRLLPPGGRIVGGEIFLDGEDLAKKTDHEMRKVRGKKISMILQESMTSLDPSFSIGNQVSEAVVAHQKLRGRDVLNKVTELLRRVRIPAPEMRLRDYPHQMSGGMRQRVTGAIALSGQPRILIADEPTTFLDVTIQAQYLSLLKEVQEESKVGMIFITHDFGIVAEMCDKVGVMYAGKIVETASIRDLFNKPLHPYTTALMNCLPKLTANQGKLTSIEGQPPDLANPPPGCSFAPRCSHSMEICQREYPGDVAVDKNHHVSCWLVAK
ncbi:ABC transporter ATP-binding protein [Chloroflexota bacterium]